MTNMNCIKVQIMLQKNHEVPLLINTRPHHIMYQRSYHIPCAPFSRCLDIPNLSRVDVEFFLGRHSTDCLSPFVYSSINFPSYYSPGLMFTEIFKIFFSHKTAKHVSGFKEQLDLREKDHIRFH